MDTVIVPPENFEKAVLDALAKYGDEVMQTMEETTKSISRQTVKEIKSSAPVKTGSYARGWTHKAKKVGVYKLSETVHNRTDYQITHLLEKPHVTGGGKRLGYYPKHKNHTGILAEIEEKNVKQYYEEVIAKL